MRALRPWRWGVLVTVLTLVSNLLLASAIRDARPDSDGRYNWLFARSLAFDHDINFANDYAVCGDPLQYGKDRGGGHPDNPFYVGPSLFWVPAIDVARAVYRFGPHSPPKNVAGCLGPIVTFALNMGSVAAALLIGLSYAAARRFVEDYLAALTAGLFAFGTTLSAYAAYFRSYSHVYDGACVAALLVLTLRAHEQPERMRRWALAGLALGACMLQRITNGPLGLFVAALAALALYRRPKLLAGAVGTTALVAALSGLLPQLLIYKYLYGRYFFAPQGPYFFQPAHGHPWLLLFAPKGLFFLAPVAWLSVAGAAYALWRGLSRGMILAVLGMVGLEVYICSCAMDWDASSSLGARRLISYHPFLIFLAAPAVGAIASWVSASAERVRGLVLTAFLAPLALLFLGTGLVVTAGGFNYDYYPSQASTYGGAIEASLAVIDRIVGGVAMLPGQVVFCLRYGAPHVEYWKAASLTYFLRDQWTMAIASTRLNLGDPNLHAAMTGLVRIGDEGARFRKRGTLVFCAGWHHATHLVVQGQAAAPTSVRVSRRGFFGKATPYGTIALTPEVGTFKLEIPPGGYDSGIEEIIFETDAAGAAVIRSVQLLDEAEYAPVK